MLEWRNPRLHLRPFPLTLIALRPSTFFSSVSDRGRRAIWNQNAEEPNWRSSEIGNEIVECRGMWVVRRRGNRCRKRNWNWSWEECEEERDLRNGEKEGCRSVLMFYVCFGLVLPKQYYSNHVLSSNELAQLWNIQGLLCNFIFYFFPFSFFIGLVSLPSDCSCTSISPS